MFKNVINAFSNNNLNQYILQIILFFLDVEDKFQPCPV